MPFALAAVVASIITARAVLTRAPMELAAPGAGPVAVARPVQQAAPLADSAAAPDQPPEEPALPSGVRVLLRSEGTTWVEAAPDGAEQRRYELGPGQNLSLAAREKLSLSLGDAGVIRLKVNEREIGFIGDKGEMKLGLSFTASKPPPAPPAAPRAATGD